MATFFQLNGAEQQRWFERSTRAQQRHGITHEAFITLCDAEHTLSVWAERECNGEIERDEPSDRWPLGRPRRYYIMADGDRIEGNYVPDLAAAAMRRAKAAIAPFPGVMIYWQTDPRGCQVYIYNQADCLERGVDISSSYSSIGTACFY